MQQANKSEEQFISKVYSKRIGQGYVFCMRPQRYLQNDRKAHLEICGKIAKILGISGKPKVTCIFSRVL